jgi:hypothetical protein
MLEDIVHPQTLGGFNCGLPVMAGGVSGWFVGCSMRRFHILTTSCLVLAVTKQQYWRQPISHVRPLPDLRVSSGGNGSIPQNGQLRNSVEAPPEDALSELIFKLLPPGLTLGFLAPHYF